LCQLESKEEPQDQAADAKKAERDSKVAAHREKEH